MFTFIGGAETPASHAATVLKHGKIFMVALKIEVHARGDVLLFDAVKRRNTERARGNERAESALSWRFTQTLSCLDPCSAW